MKTSLNYVGRQRVLPLSSRALPERPDRRAAVFPARELDVDQEVLDIDAPTAVSDPGVNEIIERLR